MTDAENGHVSADRESVEPATDAQLLLRMRNEDAAAWQQLYERYLPSAWRYAWQLVGDRQIAEDLVADSLLVLCRRADQLDVENIKLFGWLRGVIRHKAMDHHRAKARTTVAMDGRARLEIATQSDVQPSDRLEAEEQSNDVLAVLEQLEENKRMCLEWKYLEHLSVREIAERLDQTEKAVESILYRARVEFRERFERQQQKNGERTIDPFNTVEPSNGSSIQ